MTNYTTTSAASSSHVATLFKSLYMQMAAALTITGLTAYFLSGSEAFWNMLATNPSMLWIIFILLRLVVIITSCIIDLMSTKTLFVMVRHSL